MAGIWDDIISQESEKSADQIERCVIEEGISCPNCGLADLEYNGVLSLVCPNCGIEYSGSFT